MSASDVDLSPPAHAAYQRAMEARDPDAVRATLAADVVLHSPVTPKPFEGRDAVAFVLGSILEVFEDLRFVGELAGPEHEGVLFEARIGDRRLAGIDLLRFDDDGLICDFTVMLRPLSGTVALQNKMAERFGVEPVDVVARPVR